MRYLREIHSIEQRIPVIINCVSAFSEESRILTANKLRVLYV